MTKIKNTKKGMAKKTLSMSLVVAMLATSNVPVWAAEFSDGSDATVVTEAQTAEAFSDNTDTTPDVEDTTIDTATATDDYTDNTIEVNSESYIVKDLALTVGEWGKGVTATVSKGTITDKNGKAVTGLKYTWLADGYQAAGQVPGATATGTATGNVQSISYAPVKADFNKTLSVVIYKEDSDGTKTFCTTITGGIVKPYSISNKGNAAPNVSDTQYNGKEQKEDVKNASIYKFTAGKPGSLPELTDDITSSQITWNYTTKNNDFTNVTDEDITVVGTLEGTYEKSSSAYGYSYTTPSATYKIIKKELKGNDLRLNLNKTSTVYTGTTPVFKLSDVTLSVAMEDDLKVDITKALDPELEFNAKSTDYKVGKVYKIDFNVNWLKNHFATTDEAKKILSNYDYSKLGTHSGETTTVESENSYEITALNLKTCTGEVTTEYTVDAFHANPKGTVKTSDIKLTAADGTSFTVDSLAADVNISFSQAAVNATTPGTIADAITISYKEDTNNVTNSITLPITLTTRSLSSAYVDVFVNKTHKVLTTSTAKTPAFEVTYNGESYDLQKTDVFSDFKITVGGDVLPTGDYELSYSDNVNAGVVTVTITGKGSYAGSKKKVYFKIAPANLTSGLTVEPGVTVNSANNNDASLYKDVMKTKIKTTLNGSKVTLEEGKDYTLKYYYTTKKYSTPISTTDLESIKKNLGTNVPKNFVYVVASPVKNGNYTFVQGTTGVADVLTGVSEIKDKSISNVTITLDKDAYTFTGEEIVPNVVVKDGASVLEKGVDYTVKVKDNIDVGTATVTIYPIEGHGYNKDTTASTTFKIEPAKAEDVTVTFKNGSDYDYTGKQIKPEIDEVKLNNVPVTKYFDITYPTYGENVNAGTDAGSVTIAPKATTSNFTGTKKQTFNIKGKKLSGSLKAYYNDKTLVSVDATTKTALNKKSAPNNTYSFYYDGTEQQFASATFTTIGKTDVTANTDYEIKYINNVNAGYGFVAVIAKGNYEGHAAESKALTWNDTETNTSYKLLNGKLTNVNDNTVLATNVVDIIAFKIIPTVFTAKNITVSNGVYNGGLAVTPQISIKVNDKILVEGTDYELTYSSVDGKTTPDKFTSATTDKPYLVKISAKGGYKFDSVNGTNQYVWGIDKKDLKDCTVVVDKNLKATVTNGNVIEEKENFTVKDNGDGTATVSVVDGGKNYTGSVNVEIGGRKVGAPMISNVKVVGNKATVILSDEVDGASGYDYVISTDKDCITKKNYAAVNKNQAKTSTAFKYVDQGTYYAYCHAWTRDANGKKVFGEWSNGFQFSVTATTPDAPVIKSVKVSGSTVKVTYELSANATGYDVVLGTSSKKDNGELRPYNYGAHKVLNLKESTVTATFKNVPAGTWTVGMHAFNRTSIDGKKVFSPWSNLKTAKVK